jgi:hypothetical protein
MERMSDAELRECRRVMFSEGIERLYEAREGVRYYLTRRDDVAIDREYLALRQKYGQKEADQLWEKREQEIDDILRFGHGTPVWQALSGLYPNLEYRMSPNERAMRVRKLLTTVERVLRFEMKKFGSAGVPPASNDKAATNVETNSTEADEHGAIARPADGRLAVAHMDDDQGEGALVDKPPVAHGSRLVDKPPVAHGSPLVDEPAMAHFGEANPQSEICNPQSPEALFTDETAQTWDALRAVCFAFEISQRKLSMLANEIIGMSATQMVDRIRAENVREKMKEEMREAVLEFFSTNEITNEAEIQGAPGTGSQQQTAAARGTPMAAATPALMAEEIFVALMEKRRRPRWDRASWAFGLGFSSHSRFFRACLLCYGKTPHEVEIQLIDEILADTASAESNGSHEDAKTQRREESEVGVNAPGNELKPAS